MSYTIPEWIKTSEHYKNLFDEEAEDGTQNFKDLVPLEYQNFSLNISSEETYIKAIKMLSYWSVNEIPFTFLDIIKSKTYRSEVTENELKDNDFYKYILQYTDLDVQNLVESSIDMNNFYLFRYAFSQLVKNNSVPVEISLDTEDIICVHYIVLKFNTDNIEIINRPNPFLILNNPNDTTSNFLSYIINPYINMLWGKGIPKKNNLSVKRIMSKFNIKEEDNNKIIIMKFKDEFADEHSKSIMPVFKFILAPSTEFNEKIFQGVNLETCKHSFMYDKSLKTLMYIITC